MNNIYLFDIDSTLCESTKKITNEMIFRIAEIKKQQLWEFNIGIRKIKSIDKVRYENSIVSGIKNLRLVE